MAEAMVEVMVNVIVEVTMAQVVAYSERFLITITIASGRRSVGTGDVVLLRF